MESNPSFDYSIFDRLIANNINFAIYRLPNDETIQLVLQEKDCCYTLDTIKELTAESGFVMMPFHITTAHPLTIIHADVKRTGEKDIFDFLNNYVKGINHIEKTLSEQEIPSDNNTFEIYTENYRKFHDAICSSEFQKLVLSRSVNYNRDENFFAGTIFQKALDKYPEAFVYLSHTPLTGTWMGCTPELLLSQNKDEGRTVALAGTMPLVEGEIKWDTKNMDEQKVVVDYVKHQLQSLGIEFVNSNTETIAAGNIVHLKTDFVFQRNETHIGDILQALHPTPAICGYPKQEAIAFIEANESYNREYYAGFIGPINMDGQSDLYVNLRCTKILSDYLTLYAGGGIIELSDMITEWLETESKLQTILSLIAK